MVWREGVAVNTTWSTCVQRPELLYFTRKIRFSDVFRDKYTEALKIDGRRKILEIGCGPGALTQALHRWYPDAEVIGTDRDSRFVEFASKMAPGLTFREEDATCLSFPDNTFDVTISYTVQEHVEPSKFFGEQYRVLKDGGVCIVLSVRRGITVYAPCITEQTEFEKEIWNRAEKYVAESDREHGVCAYPLSEAELPQVMESHGFRNVTTEYITINLTPDNPVYPRQMALDMINSDRMTALVCTEILADIAPDVVTAKEIEELKKLINRKYDKRIELYDKGIKQWDTTVVLTMVLRGEK